MLIERDPGAGGPVRQHRGPPAHRYRRVVLLRSAAPALALAGVEIFEYRP